MTSLNPSANPAAPRARPTQAVRLPDIDWVEIPAGPFLYGEGQGQMTLDLPRFYISRYLTTHAQYQCFIDAGGYDDRRCWQGLAKLEPEAAAWPQPNRPRETVSWYEAVAYTRWLSAQWGFVVSLPTEAQWEKAARGSDGRAYPWGAGFTGGDANVYVQAAGEDNLQQTSAVGLYPHRASPYGVLDMAGNVWEWCLDKYNQPGQTAADDSGDPRVLRGGSWDDYPGIARAAYRYRCNPASRHLNLGFRVVCSSPYPVP